MAHAHEHPSAHDRHGHDGHHDHAGQDGHDEHDQGGMHHAGHEAHGGHGGHGGHSGHEGHVAMFRRMFWIMLAFAIPTVFFSPMFASLLGYSLPGWAIWVAAGFGTVMYVWGGRPFLTGAVDEIRSRSPGMMLLISLGITVAFLASWAATVGLISRELEFWWELALLIVIMLLGHWIEMRSLAQAGSALDSLAALLPDEAEKVEGDSTVTVSPSELAMGDVVVVRPGGRVPADGEVVAGSAEMDESMITGESSPVLRTAGENVVAGTVATDSGIRVRVSAVGEDTALAGIQKLVADAQNSSSRAQLLADKAASWLFWFALGSAVVTAIVWSIVGAPEQVLTRVITVLVIACPHALGLAIPLVVSIATEKSAKSGVLVKDRAALERMRLVDTVVFDKTGTLTRGEPALTELTGSQGWPDERVLAYAAAAEADSEHPLARAIVAAAGERRLDVPRAEDFTSAPGTGVEARVGGSRVQVGGPRLLDETGTSPLPEAHPWMERGNTVLHVLVDGAPAGALALADEVRPESRAATAALHRAGVDVMMITGDAENVAAAVAHQLGIDRYYAGVRPEDKSAAVAQLQHEGRTVAMVGDGVNDAPALAQADVGLAIGAGTDVAIASAGVVLADDDPRAVLSVRTFSESAYRKMQQNLWWAAGYNLLAVPLAAGITAPLGFVMPMSVGAILMSASTVVVAINAQLLRRVDLRPETVAPMSAAAGETNPARIEEAHRSALR